MCTISLTCFSLSLSLSLSLSPQVDISKVSDFNKMYELYDPCTTMFFYRNKHMMIDLGTGNNNKINWPMTDEQEFIDIVEVCALSVLRWTRSLSFFLLFYLSFSLGLSLLSLSLSAFLSFSLFSVFLSLPARVCICVASLIRSMWLLSYCIVIEINIIQVVYRGARKGRGLVVSPKDYSTKYRY